MKTGLSFCNYKSNREEGFLKEVQNGKIEKECRLDDRYWKVQVNDYALDI
jgi:hypothetical protein